MCFENTIFSSGNDVEGPPQDKNQSEKDTIEDMRKKIQELEKKTLDLTSQHNHDVRIFFFACLLALFYP